MSIYDEIKRRQEQQEQEKHELRRLVGKQEGREWERKMQNLEWEQEYVMDNAKKKRRDQKREAI